jgi:hypothetical protein
MIVANSSEHVHADADTDFATRRTANFAEMTRAMTQY